MRLDDRLALRDGQRVKDTGGALAVLFERAEERGAVPARDVTQQAQMELEQAFARVEHAPEVLAEPARDVFHVDLGHQVQVEFGPQVV